MVDTTDRESSELPRDNGKYIFVILCLVIFEYRHCLFKLFKPCRKRDITYYMQNIFIYTLFVYLCFLKIFDNELHYTDGSQVAKQYTCIFELDLCL